MKSEILGRGSGTNYNHTNNLLKGFAAAKLMFPMVVQVQPNPVRTALQLILMLGPSQHLRQAAQHWFGFVYLCFPFISWLKIWFWGTILKTFKLISPANSSPKLRPHFFFFFSEYCFENWCQHNWQTKWIHQDCEVQELSIENQSLGQ